MKRDITMNMIRVMAILAVSLLMPSAAFAQSSASTVITPTGSNHGSLVNGNVPVASGPHTLIDSTYPFSDLVTLMDTQTLANKTFSGLTVSTGTSDGQSQLLITGTNNGTNTNQLYGIAVKSVLDPTSSTITNLSAIQADPTFNGNGNYGSVNGLNIISSRLVIGANYITNGGQNPVSVVALFNPELPTNNAGVFFSDWANYGSTSGAIDNGITSGTFTVAGLQQSPWTGSANCPGGGCTLNNVGVAITLSTGNTVNTKNFGLKLDGAGGGGTGEQDFIIYSGSPALAYFAGPLEVNTFSLNGNSTQNNWGTNGGGAFYGANATLTDATATGDAGNESAASFPVYTIAATNAGVTFDNLAELYLPAPLAGTNVTAINIYSLLANGNIRTNGSFTAQVGATIFGATVNLNNNSNFNVDACTGTCTGTVHVGDGSGASTVTIENSAGTLNLNAGVLRVAGTVAVSCVGAPTSGYTTVNGITTHC